jgi:hypothetical protein
MSRQGEQREGTYENIREFWDVEAADIGRTPQVTIRDHYFRLHELQTLLTVIPQLRVSSTSAAAQASAQWFSRVEPSEP